MDTSQSLPVAAGGIGVRKSQDVSMPDFISSPRSTEMLVDAVLHNTRILASARVSYLKTTQEKWEEKKVSLQAKRRTLKTVSKKRGTAVLSTKYVTFFWITEFNLI